MRTWGSMRMALSWCASGRTRPLPPRVSLVADTSTGHACGDSWRWSSTMRGASLARCAERHEARGRVRCGLWVAAAHGEASL